MNVLPWKNLDDINEAILQALVDNKVAESRILEYKSELPSRSDADRKDFLAEVSALANSSGGHLVFGIEDKEGIAKRLVGLGSIGEREVEAVSDLVES